MSSSTFMKLVWRRFHFIFLPRMMAQPSMMSPHRIRVLQLFDFRNRVASRACDHLEPRWTSDITIVR